MYVKFLQSTHCIKKTLTVSRTLLCESGDRVKFDQSSFSADLHAVMLRHHCSEYVRVYQLLSNGPFFIKGNNTSISLENIHVAHLVISVLPLVF